MKRANVPHMADIQEGTFFEVYEVNNDEMKVGKAKEIAELLNIQLTRKSKAILEALFCTATFGLTSVESA